MPNDKLALKFFKVSPKYLNEYGELKPDAELLPYYAENHKTVDKIGQERDMLSPGSGAQREVVFIDKYGRANRKLGKDRIHGSSAYGYPYINENLHSDVPSMIDSFDPLGKFGMRDDKDKGSYYTTHIHALPNNESTSDLYNYEKYYFDHINRVLNNKIWYGSDSTPVAMLMLANEGDIISAHDILDKDYDAWRDNYISGGYEVQLKRAMPIKQVTKNDLDKGKLYIDPYDTRDFLQWFEKHKYDNKKTYEKGMQYIKEKLADKYSDYKYMPDSELEKRIYMPSVGALDNMHSYTEDEIHNILRRLGDNDLDLYDIHKSMTNVFPGDSNTTVSDKLYKNIITGFYDGLPDNYKRQKNITNSILSASRY